MATTRVSGDVQVQGLKETLQALNSLDKDAKKAVKDEVQKVANLLAREIAAAGRTRSKRDRWVADSVRGTRERTPVIKIGSAKRMPVSRGGSGPRASDLMFGMEFGSRGGTDNPTARGGRPGWRFPAETPPKKRGNTGTWIMPTVAQQQPRVVQLWAQALETAARRWGK
jgi:hypothetical protein